MNQSTELQPTHRLGCLGLAGAAVLIAGGITAVMGLGGAYGYVLLITLAIVGTAGCGAFVVIREKPTLLRIVFGGFVTGALIPAILEGLALLSADNYAYAWRDYVLSVAGFGLAGIAGALIAWGLIRLLMHTGNVGRASVILLITMGIAGIWFVPWATMDRSCHNPLRNGGTSIAPVSGFLIKLSMSEWSALRAELGRFANSAGWQVRGDVRTDADFPWFQVSVCDEAGTEFVANVDPFKKDRIDIDVYQPQGGDSWQIPFHALQKRLERRWPGSTEYDYEVNTPIPPWVPRSSKKDKESTLHPNEKSL